jgi:hypothetical protein
VTKLEAWDNREEKIVVKIEIIVYQLFMFSIFYVCRLSLYFMKKMVKHINNGVDMPFIIHSSNFLHHIGCHVGFGGNINTKCGTS